jgi:Cu(I)/Ag(I) efflux system membrane fusion protein
MSRQAHRPAVVVGVVVIIAGGVGAGFWLGRHTSAQPATAKTADPRPVLYWYDPMVPGQHFDKPGKSPFMDMQLIAKHAGETEGSAGVSIDPARLQNLGVRYATVTRGQIGDAITAPGVVDFNQRDVAVVQARSGGFVQRVYGRAPGDVIPAGAPLADVLTPDWAAAQTEFLAVRRTGDAALTTAARQRLSLLGMSPALVAEVERTGQVHGVTTITTPVGGVVKTLSVRAGMTVKAGETLAEVNGIGTVWVNASVPAAMAAALRPGQAAQVTLSGDGERTLSGRVSAVLPEVQGDTRTLQVRVELPNPGGRLRPGAFATVTFPGGQRAALTVPSEAVIRTGQRVLVMVALADGHFQPAEVQVGAESAGHTEVLSGLTEGERVVASGQFMIDSEASLSGVQTRTNALAGQAAPTAAPALAEGDGKIEQLNATTVTLTHGPIPAAQWPAMTMTFQLPDTTLGKGLKVGDRVHFAFDQPKAGPTVRRMTKEAGQ